jgi:hypothetical protein
MAAHIYELYMGENGQTINYIAAVVTGLAAFALSLLWYSPLLFGNIWMALRNAPVPPLPGWTFLFARMDGTRTALFNGYEVLRPFDSSRSGKAGLLYHFDPTAGTMP